MSVGGQMQRPRGAPLRPLIAMAWLPSEALMRRPHRERHVLASRSRTAAAPTRHPAGASRSMKPRDVYWSTRRTSGSTAFPQRTLHRRMGWGSGTGKRIPDLQQRCEPGLAGAGRGQLDHPGAIAIDNSRSPPIPREGHLRGRRRRAGHGRLLKMSPDGAILEAIKQAGTEAKWEGTLDGLSVDGSGRLWYTAASKPPAWSNASATKTGASSKSRNGIQRQCPKPGFAVDGSGESLYADHEREDRKALPFEEGEAALRSSPQAGLEEEALTTRFAALEPQRRTRSQRKTPAATPTWRTWFLRALHRGRKVDRTRRPSRESRPPAA